MWMRFWLCSLILLGSWVSLLAQDSQVELLKKVAIKGNIIESDNMGNVYLVQGGSVFKLDLGGAILEQNSALAMGDISSLDASNALKMVVFFKDLSQITYIDNQIAQRGDNVSLDVIGLNQVSAICRSYNDGLWVYDQTTFELIRLTEQLQMDVQSGNLAQIVGVVPEPTYMREFNNWLYVNDFENGVFVFDWYGSYTKTIPIKEIEKFVIRADRMFYIKDKKVQYYHLKTKQFAKLNLDELDIVDFTIFEDKLLLITQNELMIYRINVK